MLSICCSPPVLLESACVIPHHSACHGVPQEQLCQQKSGVVSPEKIMTFWTDCFSCICVAHKLSSFSGTSTSLVSLQLRNILKRVSHSQWISSAPLKHWGAFCITLAEVWGQRTAKPQIIPSPYSAFMYRGTPWRVPIYLFSLVSTQALLSQRGIKCNGLFDCVDNKLIHSSSQTRSHLSSLFTRNQEMKKDLFPETLFSEIWKKKFFTFSVA